MKHISFQHVVLMFMSASNVAFGCRAFISQLVRISSDLGMPINREPLLIYPYDTRRDNMLRVFESKFTNMQLVLTVLDAKHKYYSKY